MGQNSDLGWDGPTAHLYLPGSRRLSPRVRDACRAWVEGTTGLSHLSSPAGDPYLTSASVLYLYSSRGGHLLPTFPKNGPCNETKSPFLVFVFLSFFFSIENPELWNWEGTPGSIQFIRFVIWAHSVTCFRSPKRAASCRTNSDQQGPALVQACCGCRA